MTRADREAYYVMLSESLTRKARTDLLSFTVATMPNFDPAEFHRRYYARLTDFARGDIDRLMVFVPTQHGKSEGSTRRLPAFVLGQNPDVKIAIVSYSATKARKFNREIQRIIDTEEYRHLSRHEPQLYQRHHRGAGMGAAPAGAGKFGRKHLKAACESGWVPVLGRTL